MENEIVPIQQVSHEVTLAHDPAKVLADAKRACTALMEVVSQKKKPVIMNGEQYLEFEDWQTVAKFYGVTAKVTETKIIHIGNVMGFEATAEAIRMSDGLAISAATAMCLNDEDKWSTRAKYEYVQGNRVKVGDVAVPLFQLRSMAQTRACAKALRNVLAWVVVLAGFKPTPAEEMSGMETPPPVKITPVVTKPPVQEAPQDDSEHIWNGQPPADQKPRGPVISDPQRKRLYAIAMGAGMSKETFHTWIKKQGYESSKDVTKDDYERVCSEAETYNPVEG